MKQRIIIIFGVLISGWFFSCHKEPTSVNSFNVSLENNYFENIDSALIDKSSFAMIAPYTISRSVRLSKGNYILTIYTASQLKIKAQIIVSGITENIVIKINSNAKITF